MLVRQQMPALDLKVRAVYDESLKLFIFPKVKEFLFRVSKSSPLEVAAKALAQRNGHPEKWTDYSFSVLRKTGDGTYSKEVKIKNLSQSFDTLLEVSESQSSGPELILFYQVEKLE